MALPTTPTHGIREARSRLSNLLDSLVANPSLEDDADPPEPSGPPLKVATPTGGEEDRRHSQAQLRPGSSSVSRPGINRKRKKRDAARQSEVLRPHIMYLFDRKIDLAEFDEGTPLYVLCRAWMRNRKGPQSLKRKSDEFGEVAGMSLLKTPDSLGASASSSLPESDLVWQLPPPRHLIESIDSEPEQSSADSTAHDSSSLTMAADNSRLDNALAAAQSDCPSTASLLDSNLASWRQLRQARRLQDQLQGLRHADSWRVLRQLRQE